MLVAPVILSLIPSQAFPFNRSGPDSFETNLTQYTASLYSTILRKNVNTVIDELRSTSTIIVFRGYYKYGSTEGGLAAYPKLKAAISAIKKELPYVHLMGAISAAGFMKGDTWPNGTGIPQETWKDIAYVLPDGSFAKYHADPERSLVFDIRKHTARDFLVAWTELQIDAGFDMLFLDEIEYLSRVFRLPASDFYDSWKDISDRLKTYATSRYGINLLLGVNGGWVNDPNKEMLVDPWPYQDFISVSFSLRTMQTGTIQDNWPSYKQQILATYSSLPPIFTFLDWGPIPSPLSMLADLSSQQQTAMLEKLQTSALQNGMIFVYPLHGGNVASHAEYDAVQQGTIETVATLAKQIVQIVTITQTSVTASASVTIETVSSTSFLTSSEAVEQAMFIPILAAAAGLAAGLIISAAWKRKR
jgi:hypothetical protein